MSMPTARPQVADELIAARTNGDSRRPRDPEIARVWRDSSSDFTSTQAAAQVFRAISPLLRAFGLSDVQLLRLAPFLTQVGAIIYRADSDIERQQAQGTRKITDMWSNELLEFLHTMSIDGHRVREVVAPLPELIDLETAFVQRKTMSRIQLLRMVELRPLDLALTTAVVAEIVDTEDADLLFEPLHRLYVVRDVLDDVLSLEEDEHEGTFNCFLEAERLAGTRGAREMLDQVVYETDRRISHWIRTAPDVSLCGFSVAVAEPADDAAAARAWKSAIADPSGARSVLIEHFERSAQRGFEVIWAQPAHRARLPVEEIK